MVTVRDKIASLLTENIPAEAQRYAKAMLSRYWQNSAFAGVDLHGAAMRQAVFTQDICRVSFISHVLYLKLASNK